MGYYLKIPSNRIIIRKKHVTNLTKNTITFLFASESARALIISIIIIIMCLHDLTNTFAFDHLGKTFFYLKLKTLLKYLLKSESNFISLFLFPLFKNTLSTFSKNSLELSFT